MVPIQPKTLIIRPPFSAVLYSYTNGKQKGSFFLKFFIFQLKKLKQFANIVQAFAVIFRKMAVLHLCNGNLY